MASSNSRLDRPIALHRRTYTPIFGKARLRFRFGTKARLLVNRPKSVRQLLLVPKRPVHSRARKPGFPRAA